MQSNYVIVSQFHSLNKLNLWVISNINPFFRKKIWKFFKFWKFSKFFNFINLIFKINFSYFGDNILKKLFFLIGEKINLYIYLIVEL